MNCNPPLKSLQHLQNSIKIRFDTTTEGTFALAFKDLSDTTEKIFINDREMFHAASTMKVPVLIEAFKQIVTGKFNLTDSIRVHNHFKSIVDSSIYKLNDTEQLSRALSLHRPKAFHPGFVASYDYQQQ